MARPPRSRTTPRSRRYIWAAVARGVMPPNVDAPMPGPSGGAPLLRVDKLDVYYGRAHALQSVSLDPPLLVMDEPTEGLAPIIVDQLTEMLKSLAGGSEISVLLVEQNLGVAIDVADRVAVMVNGRIARTMSATELGADRELQQQLLGMRSSADYEEDGEDELPAPEATDATETRVYTIRRSGDEPMPSAVRPPDERTVR